MQLNPFRGTDNRGVSPVVGVILMVAITVVLGAVVGTFLLDIGSDVDESANAAVELSQHGQGADIAVEAHLISMDNADRVIVDVDTDWSSGDCSEFDESECTLTEVGDDAVTNADLNEDDTVTVIAVKGQNAVVIQTYDVR